MLPSPPEIRGKRRAKYMQVIPLRKSHSPNNCNSYLILGCWNRADDLNTIIDPGSDLLVLHEIETMPAGGGRIAVEQIILTHNPFEHAASVMAIKKHFKARVLACSEGPGIDELLDDGQLIKAGDDVLEVLHTPGRSSDSICLYAPSEKILFSGNTRLRLMMPGESCGYEYLNGLLKVACRDIQRIYSGYDEPMIGGCNEMILQALHCAQHG